MRLEEIHHLVPFSLQVWVHLPDRSETMQVFGIVLAKEIHHEMDAVLGFLLLNFLCETGEELRYGGHGSAPALVALAWLISAGRALRHRHAGISRHAAGHGFFTRFQKPRRVFRL